MARIIITTSNNLVFDNRVHKITTSLMNMGHEVWLTGRELKNKSVGLPPRQGQHVLFRLPFNKGPLFYGLLNIHIFFFLMRHHFDVLWSVDMDTLPGGRLANFFKRKQIIFDSHEFFSEVPELEKNKIKKRIWAFLEKKLIPGCDKKYTVSPGLINLYQTRYNQNFELLRNLPHLKSSPAIPLITTSKPVILYQGALNIGRGLEETIQAMKFLPDYIFRIVGDGDYTRELQALAKKLNLNRQIEFIGPVPFEDLANYHQNVMAGICLLHNQGLNYYYSLPNRLFDYMQAGIPVIASEFPDMSDIIKKHQTGLLVRDLSPGTIARTIRRACEEKSLREKWQETLPKAAKEFTWQEEEKRLYAINFGAKSGIDGH